MFVWIKKKTQLNVQIDPELLIALKSEANKNGKTLASFVIDRLKQSPTESYDDILEQRLMRIEEQLQLLKDLTSDEKNKNNKHNSIFSDSGAKKYGEVARELFEFHRKKSIFL